VLHPEKSWQSASDNPGRINAVVALLTGSDFLNQGL
jgi:hypothetical protein